jgi:hypothetical protein
VQRVKIQMSTTKWCHAFFQVKLVKWTPGHGGGDRRSSGGVVGPTHDGQGRGGVGWPRLPMSGFFFQKNKFDNSIAPTRGI